MDLHRIKLKLKPEQSTELKDKIKIPYFAIGDIHAGNIKEITACGTRRVAVCRAILKAGNPKEATKQLYELLNK